MAIPLAMQAVVWVTTRSERFHRWPEAPEDRYHRHLRSWHRHLFHFKVGVHVTDANREVSFELLRVHVRAIIKDVIPPSSEMSCETMALLLWQGLEANYPYVLESVEVSEDGENGATLSLRIVS